VCLLHGKDWIFKYNSGIFPSARVTQIAVPFSLRFIEGADSNCDSAVSNYYTVMSGSRYKRERPQPTLRYVQESNGYYCCC
jgi:hypothetical protein